MALRRASRLHGLHQVLGVFVPLWWMCRGGALNPRLFFQIVSLEMRKRMSYRADFWINAVVGLAVTIGITYFITLAVFDGSGQDIVAGFTKSSMLVYFVVVALVAKLVTLTEFEHAVSEDIYAGSLSRYLIYPAPYGVVKFAMSLGPLAPGVLQCVLFAAWMPFTFGWPEGITWASAAMCAPALALAILLQFLITFPIQSVAFWAENVWSLMVANRLASRLLGGMLIPIALFPSWSQKTVQVLPFRFLFAFPADVLLGRVGPAEWAVGLAIGSAWCLGFIAMSMLIWRRGSLQYTGVGL